MLRRVTCLLLLTSSIAFAQDQVVTLAGREVSIWKPSGSGRAPLVIYSHGYGGCPTQPGYLLRALANNGYWVVSVRHGDAGCGRRRTPASTRNVSFSDPSTWNENTFIDRRNDVHAIEAALRIDARFRTRIDFSRYAYAGHSLGGYTAVALAGGWRSWAGSTSPSAVLALCPYLVPFIEQKSLANIRAPIMFQGGSLDARITRALQRKGGAYDLATDAKYLVVFRNASHLTWGGRDNPTHDDIVEYAVAFLDRYVKGEPAAHVLTSVGDLADFRYDSELGRRDGEH
ncbi:MAG: hypothetical protein V4550_05510 [Gemmatimonadota bacterium]